ncbi:peptide-methionine (R)-S-oxide reductase [Tenacibaculum sp. MAR_2009_124]|uniref:peptide-methionine (R)-S-oxide reductase MsrB n=1 Tax=Tenacibaculum sp. MAR_2009_124 TaxID=1250059 RepID=UPI000894756E|nr:peptide-methionine (R)-S-oxide reductase MsrB [Tenacibaculum sp. MAR_2009_124]SEB54468.1 peptide-methionine (R)-S-oxide reductase [Tenacibaculum sp. MAR_2009_124]
MKKYFLFIIMAILFSEVSIAQKKEYRVSKSNKEWQKLLTPKQYYILREAGTERPFTSPLNKNYEKGVYVCAACKTPLYKSEHKYDSHSGWPSFDREIKGNVENDVDYKIGYARTELKCNTCGGHLGHSFRDGPKKTTGIRHCINGAALEFIRKQ